MITALLVLFLLGQAPYVHVPDSDNNVQYAALTVAYRVCSQNPKAISWIPVGNKWYPADCKKVKAIALGVEDYFDAVQEWKDNLQKMIEHNNEVLRGIK